MIVYPIAKPGIVTKITLELISCDLANIRDKPTTDRNHSAKGGSPKGNKIPAVNAMEKSVSFEWLFMGISYK